MSYCITKKMELDFAAAVEEVKNVLAVKGFGVLTEIDVKVTMKKKLDKDMEEYLILGACNPSLASQALDNEIEIGLLLPCNVIVYKKNGEVFVSTILPSVAMSFIDNREVKEVAIKAESKLISVIDNL